MTHEKYEELHFLKVLLDRTISPKKWYRQDDLILDARTARMTADRATELFYDLKKGEYIDEIENVKDSKKNFYIISDAGRWYYSHLVIEEQKDALDLKLKDVSIRNIKITRLIAWASLIISLAIGGIQVVRYIEEKASPKYSVTESEVKEQTKSLKEISEHLQSIQEEIYKADTSIKIVKIRK